MRIAIYSDNFYPEISGISDSLIWLGKELVKLGHVVYFFAPEYSAKDFVRSNLPVQELDLGPNVVIVRFKGLPFASSPTGQSRIVLPALWRWRIVKKNRIDIIHTNSFFGLGIEAWLAARILKLPLVGTNHTPIRSFLKYSPIKIPFLPELSVKFANWYYNKCDEVVAPSAYMLDEMTAAGLQAPSRIVSNPLDTAGFKPVDKAEKDRLKRELNFSDNTVIYCGRLASEKNIDMIVRAIDIARKEIPDIVLALAGHGRAADDLKSLVSGLRLNDNIIFLGYVDDSRLKKVYQAADIFTIMSMTETQSLSMMQAMATGLPVIVARAGALPEYVGGDRGYIVAPGDYEDLAGKIITLCRDAEQRNFFGSRGLAFAQTISAPSIAQKWTAIYQNIINKSK